MQVTGAFKSEYEIFLRDSGFREPDPQTLLMQLASLSMEVYLKEIAWLSDFIGRLERDRERVA